MRYFAKIENNNLVSQVIKLADEIENPEMYIGELGIEGTWVETWTDGGERKNFAAAGSTYNNELNAFIPKKMQDEEDFVFDENTCKWVPPIPYPTDGKEYAWGYESKAWIELMSNNEEVDNAN